MKLGRSKLARSSDLGVIVLGVWLVATGLLPLLKVSFPNQELVLDLLAVAAGVLILLQR